MPPFEVDCEASESSMAVVESMIAAPKVLPSTPLLLLSAKADHVPAAAAAAAVLSIKALEAAIEVEDWNVVLELTRRLESSSSSTLLLDCPFVFRGESCRGSVVHLLISKLGRDLSLSVLDRIFMVIQHHENSHCTRQDSKNGFTPLQLAIHVGCPVAVQERLLTHASARLADRDGNYPLHTAACLSSRAFNSILKAYPQAAALTNQRSQYPLHLLVGGLDLQVSHLEACLQAHPPAARLCDRAGRLPLHLLCQQYHVQCDTVYMVMHAYPQALHMQDGSGKIPLDHVQDSLIRQILQDGGSSRRNPLLIRWGHSSSKPKHRPARKTRPVDMHYCYG